MGRIIFYKDKAVKGITLQRSHLHSLGLPDLARHMGDLDYEESLGLDDLSSSVHDTYTVQQFLPCQDT